MNNMQLTNEKQKQKNKKSSSNKQHPQFAGGSKIMNSCHINMLTNSNQQVITNNNLHKLKINTITGEMYLKL